jgi:antitoxin component of MazEF toxin-antitoxin module
MIMQLQKRGNSFGITIPKAIIDLLGWDQNTQIKLSTPDGKRLVLSVESNQKEYPIQTQQVKKLPEKPGIQEMLDLQAVGRRRLPKQDERICLLCRGIVPNGLMCGTCRG